MEKFPNMLIGMQLVGWDQENQILTVKNDEQYLNLVFDDSDEGDCCGFNNFFAELLVSEQDLSMNPIITHVEVDRGENTPLDSSWHDLDRVKITFFGAAKSLFTIDSESGSGSGWEYGACVTVKCDAIGLKEFVTAW